MTCSASNRKILAHLDRTQAQIPLINYDLLLIKYGPQIAHILSTAVVSSVASEWDFGRTYFDSLKRQATEPCHFRAKGVSMRSSVSRLLICFCFSLLFSGFAKADSIPVGIVSFDLLQSGLSGTLFGLDVLNGTQAGGGSPVSTFLDFTSLTLTVAAADGATKSVPLNPTDAFGDFSTGSVFSADQLLSATLTGTFLPTIVTLADGSVVSIGRSLNTVITDVAGGPLQDGDLATINVTTSVSQVPEPGTLIMLGLPLLVLARRVRTLAGCRLRT